MAGLWTNGLPVVAVGQPLPSLKGTELLPVDTGLPSGEAPQSVAASAFQVAALAAGMSVNTVSATTNAGTLSTTSGRFITGSLSTAAGASATAQVLTNTLILTAATPVQVALIDGTNTTPGAYVSSVVLTANTATITITNGGAAALNGTVILVFMVGSED